MGGARDGKDDFIFRGKPVVGWSSELLIGALSRALDRLVVADDDPLLRRGPERPHVLRSADSRDVGGRALGLALIGNRAGALSMDGAVAPELGLASRLHVPLTIVHSVGVGNGDGSRQLKDLTAGSTFGLFAGDVQEALDFALLAVRISEHALLPGVCFQDVIRSPFDVASVLDLGNDLVEAFLGHSGDEVGDVTPAQIMTHGTKRRRVPLMLSPSRPAGLNPQYAAEARRLVESGHEAFFTSHLPDIIGEAFDDFGALTGRFYAPLDTYRTEDADYLLISVGNAGRAIRPVIDFTRRNSRLRIGSVRLRVVHPFPEAALGSVLAGKRAVTVLAYGDSRKGAAADAVNALPGVDTPPVYTFMAAGGEMPSAGDWMAAVGNMTSSETNRRTFFVVPEASNDRSRIPGLERLDQLLKRDYPEPPWLASLDMAAANPEARHAIRLFGPKPELTAEGAGLLALTFSAVTGHVSEGHLESGRPSEYTLDLNSEVDCIAVLDCAVLGHDAVIRRLTAGSIVVVPSAADRRLFWASLPDVFRRVVSDRNLTIFSVPVYEASADNELPGLDDQIAVNSLLGAVVRAVFGGSFLIDEIASELNETLTRNGYPSRVRVPLVDALKQGFRGSERMSRSEAPAAPVKEPDAPWTLRALTGHDDTQFDPARFWTSVGFGMAAGRTDLLSPDPYLSSRTVPALTSVVSARKSGAPPQWLPENCTGCGLCWTYCPHSALPVTVAGAGDFIEAARLQAAASGASTMQVQRLGKHLSKRLHKLVSDDQLHRYTTLGEGGAEAVTQLLDSAGMNVETAQAARAEFESVVAEVKDVRIARTEAFFDRPEATSRGTGEVLSISVDPDACTSCGICTAVCPENAFEPEPVAPIDNTILGRVRDFTATVATDRTALDSAAKLFPDRALAYRIVDGAGYHAVLGGGGADPGSGTRMAMHLVASTITSIADTEAEKFEARISDLENRLKQRIQTALSNLLEVNDFDEFADRLRRLAQRPESLALSELLNDSSKTVDTVRLRHLSQAMQDVEALRKKVSAAGRRAPGIVAVLGNAPTLLRDAQFAMNPFAFPWINAGDSDPFALAEGIFDGFLLDALETASLLRRATRIADDTFDPSEAFDLTPDALTDEEWRLVPSVCVLVEKLDRFSFSAAGRRTPLRVFWLDALSESAGSGLSIPALADPTWFLAQSVPAYPEHFLSVVSEAVQASGPSLVRVYAPEPERDGFPSHATVERMMDAVTTRVFPLFVYRPERSLEWTQRWSLAGNPDSRTDWAADGDSVRTPADWFVAEGRFAHLFDVLPRSSWSDAQIPLRDYLGLDGSAGEDMKPYVEVLDSDGKARRLGVTDRLIDASSAFRARWRLLQEMAGVRSSLLEIARAQVEEELRESFEAERLQLRSESEAQLEQTRAGYDGVFRDRLTARLLALSGFDGTSATLAEWLSAMRDQTPEAKAKVKEGSVVPE